MKQRLRRLLPTPEVLRRNRWLRWLGPALFHPRLWQISRRGIALGTALGVFFGLLIPLAQIPLSVAAAVVVRANVPSAVASTLVTNPVTFGPVYYGAWRLGSAILGESVGRDEMPPVPEAEEAPGDSERGWFATVASRLQGVGRALMLGLAILASTVGLVTYALVSWAWYFKVKWSRRRRHLLRSRERRAETP